ncbi:hypothetical protein J2Y83_000976 [Pseudomonas marginalis]|nr:hypothetical protein [Pseudomonas marginalis]MCP1522507.1 hypothetical protein [Pseudomonas marginalis]MDQ0498175.1 hypothetical protein [Pseudomonas marginalis]
MSGAPYWNRSRTSEGGAHEANVTVIRDSQM